MKKDVSEVARKLKSIRERTRLSIREMAEQLGFATPSGYQHYEDKYKKTYLPKELVDNLIRIMGPHGIPEHELLELGGFTYNVSDRPAESFKHAMHGIYGNSRDKNTSFNPKLHTKAVLVARDVLAAEKREVTEEAIDTLASDMCEVAYVKKTDLLTVDLACWLLAVYDQQEEKTSGKTQG